MLIRIARMYFFNICQLTSQIEFIIATTTTGKTTIFETILPSTALRANRMAPSSSLPSIIEVVERKKKKRIITEATELFNQDPKKGY